MPLERKNRFKKTKNCQIKIDNKNSKWQVFEKQFITRFKNKIMYEKKHEFSKPPTTKFYGKLIFNRTTFFSKKKPCFEKETIFERKKNKWVEIFLCTRHSENIVCGLFLENLRELQKTYFKWCLMNFWNEFPSVHVDLLYIFTIFRTIFITECYNIIYSVYSSVLANLLSIISKLIRSSWNVKCISISSSQLRPINDLYTFVLLCSIEWLFTIFRNAWVFSLLLFLYQKIWHFLYWNVDVFIDADNWIKVDKNFVFVYDLWKA